MRFLRVFTATLGSALLLGPAPTWADDDPEPMRRVDFQVERTRDVANDWVRAVVGVSDEDADSAALADRVNRTMAWALATAKSANGIEVKSGGYNTSPVYQDGRLRRWRASQDLILESADAKAVSDLVGKLQERLQLRSLGFTVSREKQREVEDALIEEALAAFRARASLVQKSFGASRYELVRVSINSGGGTPMQAVYAEAAMMRTSAPVAPPALEGGSSTVSVHVNGTVELD